MRRIGGWRCWGGGAWVAAAVVCLGVGVLATAVIAANRFRILTVSCLAARSHRSVMVAYGALTYQRTGDPADYPSGWPASWAWRMVGPDSTGEPPFHRLVWRPRWVSRPNGFGVVVPLWPVAVAGIGAGVALVRRARRPERGTCVCGYELAGLPAGALCPECGRADAMTA